MVIKRSRQPVSKPAVLSLYLYKFQEVVTPLMHISQHFVAAASRSRERPLERRPERSNSQRLHQPVGSGEAPGMGLYSTSARMPSADWLFEAGHPPERI